MAELTAKQQYWSEQLKLADSFDGSMSQYAAAENIPVKKLYRWRNYFRKSSTTKMLNPYLRKWLTPQCHKAASN